MDRPSNLKLELVQVLFRHGSRVFGVGESKVLKPEDIDQSLIEQYGYDQLTKLGKKQAFDLGRVLRERYDNFLGSGYRPQEVYAYSSDTDRTKMSLQLVLAGLFPPPEEQRWHPSLDWMPIPFHCAPVEFDILLKANEKPKYKEVLNEVWSITPEIVTVLSEMKDFANILKKNGVHSSNGKTYGICAVQSIFAIQNSEKRKKPNWYSVDLMNKLKHYFKITLDFMVYTTELKKLFAGTLIKRFIENLNINDEVQNPRKIYLYSGHDLNIAAVLRSLELNDFGNPDFSSAVIIEKLRDTQGRLYVRFLGWTGRDDKFITLKMGNCDEICHIDDFLNHAKEIIPSDEEIQEMYKDVDVRRALTTDFVYKHKY